jgi:hypothetical protein
VAAYLDNARARRLQTGCGYAVPYTPIQPGEYPFSEEHTDGDKVSRGIDHPVLVVAPGRDRLELRFEIAGTAYRAVYRVTCAYFDWNDHRETCAPSVSPQPKLDPRTNTLDPPPLLAPQSRGCHGCAAGNELGLLGAAFVIVALVRRRLR